MFKEQNAKQNRSPTKNTLYRTEGKRRRFDLLFFLHVYTNIIELMLLLTMHATIRLQINKNSHMQSLTFYLCIVISL